MRSKNEKKQVSSPSWCLDGEKRYSARLNGEVNTSPGFESASADLLLAYISRIISENRDLQGTQLIGAKLKDCSQAERPKFAPPVWLEHENSILRQRA